MPDTIVKTVERPLISRSKHDNGVFTLRQLAPLWDGHVTYLVSVDERGTRHYLGPTRGALYADKTIGALTKVKAGWAVTAYLDREAYLAGGEGWSAPLDVRDQTHGVRILLTYYWLLHHPEHTVDMLTAQECKRC